MVSTPGRSLRWRHWGAHAVEYAAAPAPPRALPPGTQGSTSSGRPLHSGSDMRREVAGAGNIPAPVSFLRALLSPSLKRPTRPCRTGRVTRGLW